MPFHVTLQDASGHATLAGARLELLIDGTVAATAIVAPSGEATFELTRDPPANASVAVRLGDEEETVSPHGSRTRSV